MFRFVVAAVLACVFFAAPAEAKHRHHRHHAHHARHHVVSAPACVDVFPMFPQCPASKDLFTATDGRRVLSIKVRMQRVSENAVSRVIGGRPAACPRAYCGCGASLHLFGRIVPGLNLAANWLRFPRAAPAPKMVAARRGHVFVLEQHIEGSKWLVFDANSGHGRTRMHARSIAGFQIVDPSGAA